MAIRQEERCQVIICRKGEDMGNGKKFLLKPGETIQIGRGPTNKLVLDWEGVSKHHADLYLKEQPDGIAANGPISELLLVRDHGSKNGTAIKQADAQTDRWERLQLGVAQLVRDGFSILIPAKSRREHKQMATEDRMLLVHVRTVFIDVPIVPAPKPVTAPIPQKAPQATTAKPTAVKASAPIHVPIVSAVDLEAKKAKKKLKQRPAEDHAFAAQPQQKGADIIEGGTIQEDAMLSDPEGQDVPSAAVPIVAAPVPSAQIPGPGQRLLSSPRPERRRMVAARTTSVEVLSDEEKSKKPLAARLTEANVRTVSTAAAAAAGIEEPGPVDEELCSISPISTPGVFPWQQAGKKTSKKKTRADSEANSDGKARRKKRKSTAEGGIAERIVKVAKKPILTRAAEYGQVALSDPYHQLSFDASGSRDAPIETRKKSRKSQSPARRAEKGDKKRSKNPDEKTKHKKK